MFLWKLHGCAGWRSQNQPGKWQRSKGRGAGRALARMLQPSSIRRSLSPSPRRTSPPRGQGKPFGDQGCFGGRGSAEPPRCRRTWASPSRGKSHGPVCRSRTYVHRHIPRLASKSRGSSSPLPNPRVAGEQICIYGRRNAGHVRSVLGGRGGPLCLVLVLVLMRKEHGSGRDLLLLIAGDRDLLVAMSLRRARSKDGRCATSPLLSERIYQSSGERSAGKARREARAGPEEAVLSVCPAANTRRNVSPPPRTAGD